MDDAAAAADPLTSPLRLAELARHADDRVRIAVAANAAAPIDTLALLTCAFPSPVAANPALAAAPASALGGFGESELLVLLADPACPASIRQRALGAVTYETDPDPIWWTVDDARRLPYQKR